MQVLSISEGSVFYRFIPELTVLSFDIFFQFFQDELRQLVKDEHEKLATVITTIETSQATYKGMPAKDAYIANCSKPSPAKPCKPTSKTVKSSSKQ